MFVAGHKPPSSLSPAIAFRPLPVESTLYSETVSLKTNVNILPSKPKSEKCSFSSTLFGALRATCHVNLFLSYTAILLCGSTNCSNRYGKRRSVNFCDKVIELAHALWKLSGNYGPNYTCVRELYCKFCRDIIDLN
jgi:hypothetical protein